MADFLLEVAHFGIHIGVCVAICETIHHYMHRKGA